MALLLEGLKVIDAASYVAGPAATTVMADYGADVIKLEPPGGDSYRGLVRAPFTDFNWLLTSRNKRSLSLDLKQAEGRGLLHELIKQVDVLVVNFNLAQLATFQLEYATLAALNPRLILAQVTGYGNRGPDGNRRAFDIAAWWARTGIQDMMKPVGAKNEDGTPPELGPPPVGVGGVGDHATAMSLFGAIMLALYDRERTGKGAFVSTSLAGNGAWSNGMQLQGVLAGYDRASLAEQGYRNPFVQSYRTRDDRFVLLVGPVPQREWPRLCRALGHPEWLADERFADFANLMKNRNDLHPMFTAAFAAMKLDAVSQALNAEDVTFSVVEKNADVVRDAQLIENGIIVRTESDHPDYQWTVSSPIDVAGHAKRSPSQAPDIGAHTRHILSELGYDKDAIEALVASGVVRAGSPGGE